MSISNMKKRMTCRFLCEDILENILSGLKSLARLMCISKVWPILISDGIRTKPPNFRLLCILRDKMKLLRIDENGGEAIGDDLGPIPIKTWGVLDSCNNMILCGKWITPSRTWLSVWKPITNQWADIPEHHDWGFQVPRYSDREFVTYQSFSLAAYDECRFKVIRFIYAFGHATFEMFSSDTGKWSECKAVVSVPSPRIFRSLSKSLFFKGALHLICCNYILVYHIDTDLCNFIEMPKLKGPMHPGKLWEVRGSIICCLYDNDGFQIWEYKDDDQSSKWELKLDVELTVLIEQYPEIFEINELRKRWAYMLIPFAFNQHLQCLYLRLYPRRVASYNLESRTFEVIYSFPGKNLESFSMYPLVYHDF